jgi:hypothetical protein
VIAPGENVLTLNAQAIIEIAQRSLNETRYNKEPVIRVLGVEFSSADETATLIVTTDPAPKVEEPAL